MTEQNELNDIPDIQSEPIPAEQIEPVQVQPNPNVSILAGYALMLKEIRSWGFWSLGLGAIHMVANGFLSAPWGVLLFIVGLASFFFKSSAMFIVYAITLTWAAISNFSGFQATWVVFSLFQVYLAVRIFLQFRHFRKVEKAFLELDSPEIEKNKKLTQRAEKVFPWLGSSMGCLSIVGYIVLIVGVIYYAGFVNPTAEIPGYVGFSEGLLVNFAILGLATSIGSLLSNFKYKAVSIFGIIASALTLLLELVLMFS